MFRCMWICLKSLIFNSDSQNEQQDHILMADEKKIVLLVKRF
jgi:hypothetical protein